MFGVGVWVDRLYLSALLLAGSFSLSVIYFWLGDLFYWNVIDLALRAFGDEASTTLLNSTKDLYLLTCLVS